MERKDAPHGMCIGLGACVCVCCRGGGPAVGSVPSQLDSLSQSATHGARFRRGGANAHTHTHTHTHTYMHV